MNRIIIAVVMLLIAGLICGCEIYSVNVGAESISRELNKISHIMSEDNSTEAHRLSQAVLNNWIERTDHLDKYLYHDYIDAITQKLSSLPVYAESGNTEAVIAQIEELKIQLTSLKESELPYIYNIL